MTANQNWKKRRWMFLPVFILGWMFISAIVMILWNNIIPNILHLPNISYWQAMGLFTLSRILFGGFHFRKRRRLPYSDPSIKEKLMNMSEEEKEQFKQQWRQRCDK